MRSIPLVFLILSMVTLAGCAAVQLRQDAVVVASAGASLELQDKIENGRALTLEEIVTLSAGGVADEVLLRNIEASYAVYELNASQVIELSESGVSQVVIDSLLSSASDRPQNLYYPSPPPAYRYGTGYGHHYHRYGRRRYHHHYHHY